MAGKYLKDKAYEMIREKIVNCELAPGSVLNESELIEEIGASRTPIREALNKLEQENLVTIIPKKCIIVRGITIDDIAEVFDARAVIEPQVLLQYADRISLRFLEDYQERCRTTEDTTRCSTRSATTSTCVRLCAWWREWTTATGSTRATRSGFTRA